jgi:two-component system, sensor histidine kinase and response regulator
LQGFDVARGLTALRGQTAKYVQLVRRFVQSHASDMADLADCLARGDSARALRIAHTLKGTASTLGAVALADLATKLESVLQSDDFNQRPPSSVEARIAEVDAELKALAAIFFEHPVAASFSDEGATSDADLQNTLRTLEVLLAQCDTAAADCLERNAASLHSHFGASFDQLAHHISCFDFAAALKVVKNG